MTARRGLSLQPQTETPCMSDSCRRTAHKAASRCTRVMTLRDDGDEGGGGGRAKKMEGEATERDVKAVTDQYEAVPSAARQLYPELSRQSKPTGVPPPPNTHQEQSTLNTSDLPQKQGTTR